MEERSRWPALVVGLLVLFLLALMFITARPRSALTPVERVLRDALAPVETVLATATHRVRQTVSLLGTWRELAEENRWLRREVAALRAQNHALMEAWRENQFLRGALALEHGSSHRYLAAQVVSRPPTDWWRHMRVNRGRRDGVASRMPVVTADGVVGYVLTVSERTSEVVLLVDTRSALGGLVQRTSQPVVVEGTQDLGGKLRLRALVSGADLRVGDLVVTSGLSQIFPSGLPVGYITEVSPQQPGRAAEAWVEPVVDFGRLEVVSILVQADGAEGEGPGTIAAGRGPLGFRPGPVPGIDGAGDS